MACNKYRSKNYKSSMQFVNAVAQTIPATNTVINPVVLALGNKVTDTGVAFELGNNGVYVGCSGLYRISAVVNVTGDTGGDITFALALNGEVLPETVTTITMVDGVAKEVSMETIRPINVCNTFGEYVYSVIAYSDATGVGTVNRVSGNALKLA